MSIRKVTTAVLALALLLAVTSAAIAAPPPGKGKPKPPPPPSEPPPPQPAPNQADAMFVSMMIPHHYQALLMSRMAPTRSADDAVRALASRIDVEQGLEIYMMQSWQSWNGLPVTDPVMAYHHMLQDPAMLAQMGMATAQQMSNLSASTGNAFDVLYLQLMITHHQGALRMLEDVLSNGSDVTLQFWATDMLTTQYTQILMMEEMLAQKT